MFKFSRNSIKKMEGVHPRLVSFFKELIMIAEDDFKIVEGVRTLETQQKYYTYGRTNFVNEWGEKVSVITKIDGITKKSKHQIQEDGFGHAIDIAFTGKNKAERYDIEKFNKLRKKAEPLLQKYRITWGGDWNNFKDRPHFQIKEEENKNVQS